MSKEDIIENIKNATENIMLISEMNCYVNGYLGALLDTREIDYNDCIEIRAELREWYDCD